MQAFALLAIVLSLAGDSPPAGLVVLGGRIVTLDAARPLATALAARGQRIVSVGSDEEIAQRIGPETRIVRLHGELVTPGFIEGHGHFTAQGRAQTVLDLSAARSWEEIVQLVSRAAGTAPTGRWIVGRGWHQSKWTAPPEGAIEGYPRHDDLSRVTPRNPVYLTHASGHLVFANAEAMRLAKITRTTPDPPGGQVLRDEHGEPIGILRENAFSLVANVMHTAGDQPGTPEGEAALIADVQRAAADCLSHGITSFHDAGSTPATVEIFARLAAADRLPVRLYVMLRGSSEELADVLPSARRIGAADGFLTVRAIKCAIDGALGGHGAWLLEPYADLHTSRGLNTTSVAEIEKLAELACSHDYQLCVHAIGDRANRESLDLYERMAEQHPTRESRRWRIEHAQHLSTTDIPRFAKLGVIASMQAVHAASDAGFATVRLGPVRVKDGAYMWRTLWDTGATVTNGTDVPVEPIDPMSCFHAAVTRRTHIGRTFYPEQCLTRDEALRSYTVNNAFAAFEENEKGTLSVGKLADLVVWSRDFLAVPEDQITWTRPLFTIVGGLVRYEAPQHD